jgi:hypothetical protein
MNRIRTVSPNAGLTSRPVRSPAGGREPMALGYWESWLARGVLAASALFALVAGPRGAGVAAALAFAVSFVPALVWRWSGQRVPRGVELAWVVAVALVGISDALALYDRIVYWGKFVHAAEGLLVAAVAAYLLIAYRDRESLDVHTHVVALVAMFVGLTFGAFWEFLAFMIDWIRNSDLQKSNTDTMTDMLWNNLGAGLGTLLALHAYYHWTDLTVQRELGDRAAWLFNLIGRLLDANGKLLAALVLLGIASYVAALWYAERALPFVAPY